MEPNDTTRQDPLLEKARAYRVRLADDSENGSLWIEYGDFVQKNFEMPDEVVRAYAKAAELLPNQDLRLRLGDAYVRAGKQEEGLSLIQESLAENPRSHGFCFLAAAYLRLGNYASAEHAAEEAVRYDPDFEEAYYLLGEATRKRSRKVAIACYRAAIERDAQYALAWQALGRELAAADSTLDEAIVALRTAIDLNPEDGWAMVFLANALWRTDHSEEADLWYRRAIDAFPEYEEMKKWYAQFLRSD